MLNFFKPELKVFFTDFWPNFEPKNNVFYNLLSERYEVIITENDPDILFFSVFGFEFQHFNCIRVFFSGENISPNFRHCDYSFSFDPPTADRRQYRLPQYYQYGDPKELLKKPNIKKIMREKTKFCNFIYSNPDCKKRNAFFKKLSQYKKVDSAGRFMNNIGRPLGMRVEDKWKFMKPYKFSITFENEEADYYSSEKIYEAMKVNSLPIYWGNPKIDIDFNPKSFLNYYDYGDDEALIEQIIEIDKNDDLYKKYLKQPFFHGNKLNEYVRKSNILKQLDYIVSNKIEPVSAKSPYFSKNPIERVAGKAIDQSKRRIEQIVEKGKRFSFQRLKLKLYKMRRGQKF